MSSTLERFWAKVEVGPADQCWHWTASLKGPGYKSGRGYGQFWTGHGTIGAHRFAAKLKFGMFDERLVVMHTCDNTICVNPAHLQIGTIAENVRDMDAKGRRVAPANDKHPRAILSDADISDIRRRHRRGVRAARHTGCSTSELAREYGVTPGYIVKVVGHRSRRLSQWAS